MNGKHADKNIDTPMISIKQSRKNNRRIYENIKEQVIEGWHEKRKLVSIICSLASSRW